MPYDPERHHRRSIRLPGYNYAQPGIYFVTICVEKRACPFGAVDEGVMIENDAGQIVRDIWQDLTRRFPGLMTDAFVIMPNHIHGIIMLGTDPTVGARFIAPGTDCEPPLHPYAGAMNRAPTSGPSAITRPTLGQVIRAFKAVSTHGIRAAGFPHFAWQRNYHEHIVRTDRALDQIRAYIDGNPAQWPDDPDNPANPVTLL